MSKRVCHSEPGYGACCQMAMAGQLNQSVPVNVPGHGVRCGKCIQMTKKNNTPGFKFRFQKNNTCGLGPSGCPIGAQGNILAGGTVPTPSPFFQ